ncbi:MAG: hypothetical protein ABSH37_07045 [Bryobacteraceae bacterium]|jgi:hypothetical protein
MGSKSDSNPGSSGTRPASGTTPAASGSTPASGTTPAAGTTPPALPVALKVSFTLNTPDGLRKVSFGLEKDTDGVKVDWTITFMLYERTNAAASFGDPVVSLNVFVAVALHANAQAAVDNNGLTPAQTAHATGPAADAAKAAQAGTMPAPLANNIIQNTLK